MLGTISGNATGNATGNVSNIITLLKFLEHIQGGVIVTNNFQ